MGISGFSWHGSAVPAIRQRMPNDGPMALVSYSRKDSEHDSHALAICKMIEGEVRTLSGDEPFELWLDQHQIKWGQRWQDRIDRGLQESTFLIPIMTPRFFNSEACREEYERFKTIEQERSRTDLILPIYYINAPPIEDALANPDSEELDAMAADLISRQWADWRPLREADLADSKVRTAINRLAKEIRNALERSSEPAVAPNRSSDKRETLIVNRNSDGYYKTIQEAIDQAKPGDRIQIHPGRYREQLKVTKPIDIVGTPNRDEVFIESSHAPVIQLNTTGCLLEHVSVECTGIEDEGAIHTECGTCVIRSCRISAASISALRIVKNATVQLCEITKSGQYGIYLAEKSHAIIEDNEISGCPLAGVLSQMNAESEIRRNVITKNRWGLSYYFYGTQDRPDYSELRSSNDLQGNRKGEIDSVHKP